MFKNEKIIEFPRGTNQLVNFSRFQLMEMFVRKKIATDSHWMDTLLVKLFT